ncbi:glycosyltransferase family 4 protein [Orrella daihaiensis]|uniref:Glycosyltransferase family 4 protein n=1 Tax=Orrella daihaiensis TaxID=2782176 RepID=A0ABY4AKZ4_9BURK|nr:glycosyltransferase family 1 protein [Orrella daihaiensis]UOD49732.1 glycosyltransferase family 4 protein [Orrella daihaiensis]
MKITIDATGISAYKTGTVTYLLEILAQWNQDADLEHEFIIFCAPSAKHHFECLALGKSFSFKMASNSKLIRMLWQQTALPYYLWRNHVDVHWGPGFILPLLKVCPMAVTVHDMTFELLPRVHEPIKRIYFPFMIRRAIKRAGVVFAVSNSTAKDIDLLLPGNSDKIVVTPLAAGKFTTDLPSASSVSDIPVTKLDDGSPWSPYVLFIGTLEPRKNLERLLQAWRNLAPEARASYRLLVIGAKGWMVDRLRECGDESVEFLGHKSDTELAWYLRHATFLAYPSLYEGFGLPVIEAMAAGTPVLTSDIAATREVAQDAAVLVEPLSVSSIQAGLSRLLLDPALRDRLSALGIARAKQFSWETTARRTLLGLKEISAGA